ncbi:MAG: hypothetical protein ACLQLC_20260 [Candidatus Sulfotelmatobacter sp.]
MERPPAVTAIAIAFFAITTYLWIVGAIELAAPGTISPSLRAPFMYGRELAGPQTAFLVGAGWALVGWGLFQLCPWARWTAVVLMVLGIIAGIPAVSAASIDPGWRVAWYGGQMMAKVVAAWYLLQAPDAIEAFKQK